MKTKIFIIMVCGALLSLFTDAVLAQEKPKDGERHVAGMIRGQQKPEQHGMMDMQKMDGIMDSCTIKCDKMMEHIGQMDDKSIMGGKTGMDAMMGTVQGLNGMTDQMKLMNQHINKMMASKEIMGNKEQAQKMREMQVMIGQTTSKLNQMTDLTQKMMGTMQINSTEK